MKKYLLDTSPLTAHLFGRRRAVQTITPWIDAHEVATSIVVYGEVVEYLKSSPDFSKRLDDLRTQLQEIRPYALTYAIMERYADIRRQMRAPHGTGLIGDVDTLIAATALERNLIVVTRDAHFQRVPGLTVLTLSAG